MWIWNFQYLTGVLHLMKKPILRKGYWEAEKERVPKASINPVLPSLICSLLPAFLNTLTCFNKLIQVIGTVGVLKHYLINTCWSVDDWTSELMNEQMKHVFAEDTVTPNRQMCSKMASWVWYFGPQNIFVFFVYCGSQKVISNIPQTSLKLHVCSRIRFSQWMIYRCERPKGKVR